MKFFLERVKIIVRRQAMNIPIYSEINSYSICPFSLGTLLQPQATMKFKARNREQ
jgi:hypothetical protein